MKQDILNSAQRAALRANGANGPERFSDLAPVLKLYLPDRRCTWLLVAMDPKSDDAVFGLVDDGVVAPHLGWVSLEALAALRGDLGLPVRSDPYFSTQRPLEALVKEAERLGIILTDDEKPR